MTLESGVLLVGAISFVAYLVRGITGAASAIVFNALFAVGLALGLVGGFSLLDGLYWIALGDLVAGLVMLFVLRRELVLEAFILRLLLVLIPAAVVFSLLLPRIDTQLLIMGLGLVLVLSGAYLSLRRTLPTWDSSTLKSRAVPTGLAAGALSGLYGMPGPIVLVYLAHAGPETRQFRARSTIVFSTLGIVRGVTLMASGAVGREGIERLGLMVPIVIGGLAVGMWLHPRVGPRLFRVGLGLIVAVAGLIVVARTILA